MQGRRQQAGGEIVGLLIRFSLAVEFFPSPTPRSTQSLSYPLLSVALPPKHHDVGSRTQPSGALSFPVRPWLTQNAIKLVPVYQQWSCYTLSTSFEHDHRRSSVAGIILTIDFVQQVTLSLRLVNGSLERFFSFCFLPFPMGEHLQGRIPSTIRKATL